MGRLHPDASGREVDARARAREDVERPVAEDLDPDLLEDPERRAVDRLDLVGRQDLDRLERIDEPPPRDLAELQRLLDTYRGHYNEHRRKKHLHGMTPGQRYRLGPQDGPGSAPLPAYLSVTTGKVSTSGCVGIDGHLFSVGRRHAHQLVTLIKQGRQVAILSRDQLLAEVQLTGHRGYQRRLS